MIYQAAAPPAEGGAGDPAGAAALVIRVKIDLANIAGTPGERGRFRISELVEEDDYACVGPVEGELIAENTGSLLLLRGRLHGVLKLACVRCLTGAEQALDIEVEEEFSSEDTAPDVDTIDRDEPEASAILDYVLDANEFVRQQVSIHLPMAFLCRPDCRGLCPDCGRNLNEGPCGCPREAGDERWARLGELLGKGPDQSA